jgi:Domain of unknown function (DUF1992)
VAFIVHPSAFILCVGYNLAMLFKHVDIESALRRLADRRIEEAMKAGKFDNLPGAGKPLDLEPMPAEENARLTWWALRILRSNQVVPDEVCWRKTIDVLREELRQAREVSRVRVLVTQINALVRRVNTLGTNALKAPVVPVDLEAELAGLRDRQTSVGG